MRILVVGAGAIGGYFGGRQTISQIARAVTARAMRKPLRFATPNSRRTKRDEHAFSLRHRLAER